MHRVPSAGNTASMGGTGRPRKERKVTYVLAASSNEAMHCSGVNALFAARAPPDSPLFERMAAAEEDEIAREAEGRRERDEEDGEEGQVEDRGGFAEVLFSGSRDGTIKCWSSREGDTRAQHRYGLTMESHVDWVNDLTMVGSELLLSCSSDTTIKAWHPFLSTDCVRTFRHHNDYVTSLAAARDTNLVASGGLGSEVYVWDIEACISPIARPPSDGTSDSPSLGIPIRGGAAAFASLTTSATPYNSPSIGGLGPFAANGPGRPGGGVAAGLAAVPSGHSSHGQYTGLPAATAERLASGGAGFGSGMGGGRGAGALQIAPVGEIEGAEGGAYLPLQCKGQKESVYALAINDAGTMMVSGGTEKALRVWDPRTGTKQWKLKGHTDNVRAVLLDPSGRYCLSGSSDAIIRLWDVGQQRCIHSYARVHTDSVWALAGNPAVSAGAIIYSGGRNGALYATNLKTRASVLLATEDKPIVRLALVKKHPQEQQQYDHSLQNGSTGHMEGGEGSREWLWAATTDSSFRRWPAAVPSLRPPGGAEGLVMLHESRGSSMCFSPPVAGAGGLEASMSRGRAEDVTEGLAPLYSDPLEVIPGTPAVIQYSVLNNRRHILSKDTEGNVKLWEITRGALVEDFGKVSLEEKEVELFEKVSVPSWFTVDSRLGSLAIHLEPGAGFAAEMYAVDCGAGAAAEDTKLNLGHCTLKGLFKPWVAARIERQAQLSHQQQNQQQQQPTFHSSSHALPSYPSPLTSSSSRRPSPLANGDLAHSNGPLPPPPDPAHPSNQSQHDTSSTASVNDGSGGAGGAEEGLEGLAPAFIFPTNSPPSIITEGTTSGLWRKKFTELDGTEGPGEIPWWAIDAVLHDKLPPKEPVKCSFLLVPHEGSSLQQLAQGKLSAPRILRVQKVIAYVMERLGLEERPADEDEDGAPAASAPSGRSSASTMNGGAASMRNTSSTKSASSVAVVDGGAVGGGSGGPVNGAAGGAMIEVLCNNEVLPPEMSLATIRAYVWKKPEDLILSYRIAE
eukprot:TRINITY_DN713_c0_g2_i5.p1 TRINITY_DN713_c0_g2~~TRINITY_DN713_c0_g2_i5.p1  ORF type:complete len:1017 (-),score=193.27 TRINITY_DN713_c0_g2_i5:791-3841(-)